VATLAFSRMATRAFSCVELTELTDFGVVVSMPSR